tara:strand:+ start:3907 stop:5391 length:1485 start_codon:yes stop_codon:yes gene_type:complete
MGTYRQPSQIIDKSLNTLNQGLQNVQQTMTAELNRRREIELKKAEEAEKKFKAFESSRDTKVDEYKYAMSDWKTINQGKDPNWESEDVSIENQLKNNALYYLDIMSGSVEGDERYRNAELSIKNMIRDYPVMAELLNSEAQEYSKTLENPNLLIETDDPLAKTKQGMLGDIFQGKNPYKFNVQTGPQGMSIKYRGEDGTDFNLRAQDYEKHVSNGYNLIDTTNNDTYNEFMEGVWGVVGQDYDPLVDQTKTFKDNLATGKTTTSSETTENFRRANASVEKQIHAYVDKGAPITQNEWQLLGGTGVYRGTDEQKTFLKTELTMQQIAMNGVPNKDLIVTATSSTESRTPGQGSDEDKTTNLSTIDLTDVENIITDTRKQVADYRKTSKPNPIEELKIREESSTKIADILNDEFKNEILKFGDEKIEIDSFDVQTDSNGSFVIQPLEISRGKLSEAGVSYIIKDFDDLNKFKKHLRAGDKELSRSLKKEGVGASFN